MNQLIRRLSHVALCTLFLIVLTGCGSLQQPTSFDQLSDANRTLVRDWKEPSLEMKIGVFNTRFTSSHTVSYMVPAFPYFYSEILGYSSAGKNESPYCLTSISSLAPVIPVIYDFKAATFSAEGVAETNSGFWGMPIVFFYGYSSNVQTQKSFWEFGFVKFPYVGSFIGFGTDYLQLLWIPFNWPDDTPKLDYMYIGY